jgi:peptide deformylase
VITVLDPTPQSFWEGCLSIPEIRALVERPRKVRVDFIDETAQPRSITTEGFLATVLQHELDHLDGVLFVDRLKTEPGRTRIAFTEEYVRYDLANSEPGAGQLED